jgi:hypothetical protein
LDLRFASDLEHRRECTDTAYLLAEDLGGVADTTNDTQTTCVGDSSCKLGSSSYVHTGEKRQDVRYSSTSSVRGNVPSEEDGVLDTEELGDGGSDDRHGTRMDGTKKEEEMVAVGGNLGSGCRGFICSLWCMIYPVKVGPEPGLLSSEPADPRIGAGPSQA